MAHLIHSVLPRPPRKIACIKQNETLNKCMDIMADLNIGALVEYKKNKADLLMRYKFMALKLSAIFVVI